MLATPVTLDVGSASPLRLSVQAARAEEASDRQNALTTDASTEWIALVARLSIELNVPADVLRALVAVESGGNAASHNPETGAVGLTMITPDITTAQGTRIDEMADPRANLAAAARYLVDAKVRWGTWELAVAEWEGLIDGSGTTQAVRHRRDSADFGYMVRFQQALDALASDGSSLALASRAFGYGLEAVGMPYVAGAASLESGGFDCSGLISWAYLNVGIELPRSTYELWDATERVDASELRVGDLVFFEGTFGPGISHAGIYAGNGYFLHSQSEGYTVRLTSLSDPYWQAHLAGFGRVNSPDPGGRGDASRR